MFGKVVTKESKIKKATLRNKNEETIDHDSKIVIENEDTLDLQEENVDHFEEFNLTVDDITKEHEYIFEDVK